MSKDRKGNPLGLMVFIPQRFLPFVDFQDKAAEITLELEKDSLKIINSNGEGVKEG